MRVIVSSVLSFHGLDADQKRSLRERYTFFPRRPPGTPSHVRLPPVSLSKVYQDFVIVPRDMQLLLTLPSHAIVDAQDPPLHPPSLNPCFSKSLDTSRNQPMAVEQCIHMLTANPLGGGCLLSLPPGFGKTACSLYISSKIATRTLILVHTSVLAAQWKDRVESFLENALPVIVSSQKVPNNLHLATHVIALLQTVVAHAKQGKTSWLDQLHDLVIVDECHHICAKTLCKVMEIVGSKYRLGLSATLARKDGLDTMLASLLGPIAFECERHDEPGLTVRVIRYHTHTPPFFGSFVECVNNITSDEQRTGNLLDIIVKLYNDDRHIIVLSDRLQQLFAVKQVLEDDHKIPVYMAIGGSAGTECCVSERPVMLATYQFASEGLDIPSLNTCVMASPRVDVKQSVGRILRSPGGNPLVVDIVDEDFPMLRRQFAKRKRFYTSSLEDGGLNATIVESRGTQSIVSQITF